MRISTTERSQYKECRRLWDYNSNNRQNLEPKKPQPPLWLGTGVHEALSAYYSQRGGLVETFETWADAQLRDLRETHLLDAEEERRFAGLRELGAGMLRHYGEWAKANDHFTMLVTEFEFEVPILTPAGEPVLDAWYVGRFDGVLMDEAGYLWVIDHKTVSSWGDETEYLELDDQTASYQWACQYLIEQGRLPGVPRDAVLRGAMHNRLRKKVPAIPRLLQNGKLSRDMSQDTTYEVYLAEIERYGLPTWEYQDVLDRLQTRGNTFFKRVAIERGPREVQRIGERLYWEYMEMQRRDQPIYPTPRIDCSWRCAFKSLCRAENMGEDVEFVKQALYKQRPWKGMVYTRHEEGV